LVLWRVKSKKLPKVFKSVRNMGANRGLEGALGATPPPIQNAFCAYGQEN